MAVHREGNFIIENFPAKIKAEPGTSPNGTQGSKCCSAVGQSLAVHGHRQQKDHEEMFKSDIETEIKIPLNLLTKVKVETDTFQEACFTSGLLYGHDSWNNINAHNIDTEVCTLNNIHGTVKSEEKADETEPELSLQVSKYDNEYVHEACNDTQNISDHKPKSGGQVFAETFPTTENFSGEVLGVILEGAKLYACEYCNKIFSMKSDLISHKKYHKDLKINNAPINSSKRHYRNETVSNVSGTGCERQNGKIKKRKPSDEAGSNQSAKVQTQLYQCALCEKQFSLKHHLKRHIQSHDKTTEKKFKCDKCPAEYKDSRYLKDHAQRHLGWSPHKCTMCDMTYTTKWVLQKHMTRVHSSNAAEERARLDKQHHCKACELSFYSIGNLKRHQAGVHGPLSEPRRYKCDHCGMDFTRIDVMKKHITRKHTQKKECVCDFCGRSFAFIGHLLRHMNRKHAKEKP